MTGRRPRTKPRPGPDRGHDPEENRDDSPAAADELPRRHYLAAMGRLLVTLLVSTAALTACGDDGDTVEAGVDGDATTAIGYRDLDGRTFVATGATGYEIVADTVIALSFEDERISADPGCNTFTGGVAVTDEGRLELTSPLTGTMMGCAEPLMAQDQWLADLLEAGPGVSLAGDTLTLTAGDESLELSADS